MTGGPSWAREYFPFDWVIPLSLRLSGSTMNLNYSLSLRRLSVAAISLLALAFSTTVSAFTLTLEDVIGYVINPIGANPEDETRRLQYFIDLNNNLGPLSPDDGGVYVPVLGPDVPLTLPSPATFATKITTSTLPVEITAPHLYVLAKFGPDSVFYYLGGQTGSLESVFIPAGLGTTGNGLSHLSLFNLTGGGPGVPDSGGAIVLLAGALSCLAILRRRFAR